MEHREIHNANLLQATEAMIRKALDILRDRFRSDLPPTTQRLRLSDTESSWYSYTLQDELDWDSFLEEALPAIRESKEHADVCEELRRDPDASSVLGQRVGIRQWTSDIVSTEACVEALLRTCLRESDGLGIDVSISRSCSALQTFLRDPTLYLRAWSPLLEFDMEDARLELGDGTAIVPLKLGERERLLHQVIIPDSTPPLTGNERYAIEYSWNEPRVVGPPAPATDDWANLPNPRVQIEQALTALRLYKRGAVAHQRLVIDWASWTPFRTEIFQLTMPASQPLGARYQLTKDEAKGFVDFWQWYRKALETRRPRIDTAIRRFNDIYDRMRLDDRLIDLAIVIEALLLDGGVRQELSYRAALRGAVLLGQDVASRKAIFRRLRDAYNARSKIVHGGDPDGVISELGHPEGATAFVEALEDDLRSALVATLRSMTSCTEREHFERLDERILSGGET